MEIDNTTIKDLAIFNNEDQHSIFEKFDLTATSGGSQKLRKSFDQPLNTINEILEVQKTVEIISSLENSWPKMITNGTLMVVHKFFDTPLDQIPPHANITSSIQYKLLHAADFSLVKYSALHAFDLLKGMSNVYEAFSDDDMPGILKKTITAIKKIVNNPKLDIVKSKKHFKDLSLSEILNFAYFIRYIYKEKIYELIDQYYILDAWRSMGLAKQKFNLTIPIFLSTEIPSIDAVELYHILLPKPISYKVSLSQENNFVFLTGANMAGKSTFIKAIGSAVFLAHIGMGVPAKQMKLSLFDGMLSNINVADNISKGESYFYNEVQRIKNTLIKITDGRKWLVLIDELFKGTNVEDAMSCSTAVIEGLIKIKSSLFILSTHLYEIGENLKKHSNISFKYFETTVDKEQLYFSYQLQNGISNDRLGYLILKREKVIEMLDKL